MDTLPTEVICLIIGYLDLRCQVRLSAVSVRWRAAVSDCLRRRQCVDTKDLEYPFCTNAALRTLLPRLPALSELRVHSACRLDINIVSENCPLLEKLDLSQFRLDTDSVERLCRRCPRLWDLHLFACSSEFLELLLRRLPGVRVLKLQAVDVSAVAVALLPACLERLDSKACHLAAIPRQPADRWPRLTDLDGGGPASELAKLVAGCPRLQRLNVTYTNVDNHVLELLPADQMLHLNLSWCGNLAEDHLLRCFGRLRQLRTLNIYNGRKCVTDRVLTSLAGLKSLTELTLGAGDEYNWGESNFTVEVLQRLAVDSVSLRSVWLVLWDKRELISLIAGLASQLGQDRDFTLVIPQFMLEDLPKSVLPLEPGPLRLVGHQVYNCRRYLC